MPTERAPHNMTANNSPSPYIASAATSLGAGFEAYRAFNGSVVDPGNWAGFSGSSGILTIDMGAGNSFIITNYDVQADNPVHAGSQPKDWTLEGSNNGSDWAVLDTVTGETGWTNGELRSFVCDVVTTAYRYFRLNISANNADTNTVVGELYLQGEPDLIAVPLSGSFSVSFSFSILNAIKRIGRTIARTISRTIPRRP